MEAGLAIPVTRGGVYLAIIVHLKVVRFLRELQFSLTLIVHVSDYVLDVVRVPVYSHAKLAP